jgi:ubiquinone/menaquinone biosynthesis C-methylase UbiE
LQNEEPRHTKEAFDSAAGSYDSYENNNEILQWMRSVVHKVYLDSLKPGEKVLELNCGTGIDALFLAENNIKVFATDISPKMISIVKQKSAVANNKNIIGIETASFDVIDKVNETGFDAVVSNFGGLNCINNFDKLSADLSAKLKPGGKFIAVVMNKFCPWEMLYYILKLDFKNAFRRLKKTGIYAELNGEKVLTYYYSPAEFGKKFSMQFKTEKIYSLGYYTPPPYLIGIYRRLKPLVKLWMLMDDLLKGIFPINRFGDHFIIILSSKS